MRAFRILLRASTLLCLATAGVSLAALSAEYPGMTAAGHRVALRELLPLTVLAWVHLGVLEQTRGGRSGRLWIAAAMLGDVALLLSTAGDALRDGAPITVALPGIAALMLASVIGVAWSARRLSREGGAS